VSVTVRPPGPDQVAEVVRVINEASQAEFGVDDINEQELGRWFSQPGTDVRRDVFVAVENGRPAAYADVGEDGESGTQFWLDVRLPPGASEPAGEALLEAAERRAVELAAAKGADGDRRLIAGAWSVNERLNRLLERAGFRLYRHSFRMTIELDGEIAEPAFAEGLTVRGFEPGDERAVFEAVDEAFRDSWDHVPSSYAEWRHWTVDREDFDPSLWWLALDGDAIAGFCLCRVHETEQDLGWVSSLGVRRPWRRRGIARALLLASFHEFRRRGLVRVGLGVDADSQTGANLLYESAGMRPVRRYDLYQKALP
jgi:ribosomal protein S18 acetylase RimI-like enzyme